MSFISTTIIVVVAALILRGRRPLNTAGFQLGLLSKPFIIIRVVPRHHGIMVEHYAVREERRCIVCSLCQSLLAPVPISGIGFVVVVVVDSCPFSVFFMIERNCRREGNAFLLLSCCVCGNPILLSSSRVDLWWVIVTVRSGSWRK